MRTNHSPKALKRADVRRCGTLWYAEPLADSALLPAIPGIRIRAVNSGDAAALHAAMVAANADQPRLAEVRLRGNRLGYLAEALSDVEGATPSEALSYGWIARAGDTVDDLGFPLELPPTEGWIYDCATVPAARGRGIYTALLLALRAGFSSYGLERGWIGTAPANWASQRGIARAGFQKVADMDWSGATAIAYGAPGIPEGALYILAQATGDAPARVLPDAGIPWIEAVLPSLMSRDGSQPGSEPEGLRRFRKAYGEQIHWTRHEAAPDAEGAVTLHVSGAQAGVPLAASFERYAAALESLAPGLPLLDENA